MALDAARKSRLWKWGTWVQKQLHGCALVEEQETCDVGFTMDRLEKQLQELDGAVPSFKYIFLIRKCGDQRQLPQARRLHQHLSRSGANRETFIGNLLVEMFANCGSLQDARMVFDSISNRNSYSFAVMISVCEQYSDGWSAVQLFREMNLEGYRPCKSTFLSLVSSCSSMADAVESRRLRSCLAESGIEPQLRNGVVNMYIKCGSLAEARDVFDKVEKKDVFSWTALIGACAQQGCNREALELFQKLEQEGLRPDAVTFIEVLRACTNLETLKGGIAVHEQVLASGNDKDEMLGNAIVHMYSKCGDLRAAREVFDLLNFKRVSSWNTMITAYAREGMSWDAIQLYQTMMMEGTKPNDVTFLGLLGACSKEYSKHIHECVIASGLETHLVVGTALVTMYGKSGKLEEANQVFGKLSSRNVVTWNAMIAAYAQYEEADKTLKLLKRMDLEGIRPNKISFVSLLGACSEPEYLVDGESLHERILVTGNSDAVLDSALLNMYCKCGSLEKARLVLRRMPVTSLVPWTTMIAAYAQHGDGREAMQLFRRMDLEGIKPDEITLVNVLEACYTRAEGEIIHERIVACGFKSSVVDSNLVIMYSRLGELDVVVQLFNQMDRKDVFSSTAMIAAYAQHGKGQEAVKVYQNMDQEGLKVDDVTYAAVLDACSKVEAVEAGKLVHERIDASSLEDPYVITGLVSMYGKCGEVEAARALFDKVAVRSKACWNAMLAAYAQQGCNREALRLYEEMEAEGIEADELTYVAVVTACSNLSSLRDGRPVHERVIRDGLESGQLISAALVNMYGKCGSLKEARQVFDKWCKSNVVAWNCLILAYACSGQEEDGLQLYRMMTLEGVESNEVTLTCVLFACSHGGMVEQGWKQFLTVTSDIGVVLRDEHYSCMMDLLGRVGRLEDAERFIESVPQAACGPSWMALLKACQVHGDLERAERVWQKVIDFNPERSASYVLLANIYSAAKRWKDAARVRKLMEDMWLLKQERLDSENRKPRKSHRKTM